MSDEFKFEGKGTLKKVDAFVSRAGKTIITLIVETSGEYPQVIPIKCFGRLGELAQTFRPGATVSITGHLGGRDWNGKVYGDNVAETVEVVGSEPARAPEPPPVDDDVPF